MENYVFVYGTLMSGMHNHYIIQDGVFVGKCTTKNEYGMYIGRSTSIPFVLQNECFSTIKGELYKLSNKILSCADWLEGHPTYYERREIDVVMLDGSINKAWLYFYNGSKYHDVDLYKIECRCIDDGDYRNFKNN